MPEKKRPTVLITGFGPFPGVPENPSATLAFELCHQAQFHWPAYRFIPHVFSTEWQTIQSDLNRLCERENPALILHFGLGAQRSALHIERQARNHASGSEDASGCVSSSGKIHHSAPDRHQTNLPLFTILSDLQSHGINAHISSNAGSYLCNYLYYNSLQASSIQARPPLIGFFHIPTCVLANSIRNAQSHRTSITGNNTQLNWTDLLTAGMILLSRGLSKAGLAQPLQRNIQRNF